MKGKGRGREGRKERREGRRRCPQFEKNDPIIRWLVTACV